ncbi:MAG: hypothetical protein WAL16_11390 [Streptosporangiaceae bacterium]
MPRTSRGSCRRPRYSGRRFGQGAEGRKDRQDAATLAEFDAGIRGLHEQADPAQIVQVAIAAIYTDPIDDCREPLWRVIRDGRAGGAVTSAIRAMMALSVEAFTVGRWDEAQELSTDGLRLCDTYGCGLSSWFLRLGQAMAAAGRGEDDLVGSLTEQMMRWAAPRRVGAVQMFAEHARGLSAPGQSAFEEAYRHFSAIPTRRASGLQGVSAEDPVRSGRSRGSQRAPGRGGGAPAGHA